MFGKGKGSVLTLGHFGILVFEYWYIEIIRIYLYIQMYSFVYLNMRTDI